MWLLLIFVVSVLISQIKFTILVCFLLVRLIFIRQVFIIDGVITYHAELSTFSDLI
jgi:hypothetical protein